jgi:hypothetical protein
VGHCEETAYGSPPARGRQGVFTPDIINLERRFQLQVVEA